MVYLGQITIPYKISMPLSSPSTVRMEQRIEEHGLEQKCQGKGFTALML